jgi:formylglycine-generating enzyme required for sulfatase activity
LTPFFDLLGWWIWSKEAANPSTAFCVHVLSGQKSLLFKGYSFHKRAFAVRAAYDPSNPAVLAIGILPDSLADQGRQISLTAEGRHEEAKNLPEDRWLWYSDIDGFIGRGRCVATTDLSMGRHTIALIVSGEKNIRQSAAAKVVVTGPFPSVGNRFNMIFEQIPAGSFMMGSAADTPGRSGSGVPHRVTLTQPFYLQTTEVTQAQWKAVTGRTPSGTIDCPDCPVTQVSWTEVQAFIHLLNEMDDKTYRLPSEAEWEYAAKTGGAWHTSGRSKTEKPAEAHLSEAAWYRENARNRYWPAGRLRPNAWGLYDMLGNVWEWCEDFQGPYNTGDAIDPKGPPGGSRRIVRGGSYDNGPDLCSPFARNGFPPDHRGGNLGFRLVYIP